MTNLILLDLDGTIYERGALVPGADQTVAQLRRQGHVIRFFTNTDSLSRADMVSRVRGYGIPVTAEEVFTPVAAAEQMLAASPGARAFVLGNARVRGDLARSCTLLSRADAAEATHVVIGDCQDELSYPILDAAFRAVRAGARLIALQHGRYWRGRDGDHIDTGAVVAAVEYAAEVQAQVLGKPSPDFLRLAIATASEGKAGSQGDRAETSATAPDLRNGRLDDVWIVGDDRATDILMGRDGGVRTAQVRTGKYSDQEGRHDLAKADVTLETVADLPALLAAPK